MTAKPTTQLCTHTLESMNYRDQDLVHDLLGKRSFTEVMFMQVMGREPRAVDIRILDAVLITLMEHGFTPSAIATRMVYMSAPENLQGAVAAGLMAVGSQFVGTMENNALILERLISSSTPEELAREIVLEMKSHREHLPGFGHHLHKPDDPRTIKLLALADREPELTGTHVKALRLLAATVDDVYEKHITINATGATAALLGEIGIPARLMRGFAVISRAAGLVSHIAEEQMRPAGRFIWDKIDEEIPYIKTPLQPG
jgi:citrate synthase